MLFILHPRYKTNLFDSLDIFTTARNLINVCICVYKVLKILVLWACRFHFILSEKRCLSTIKIIFAFPVLNVDTTFFCVNFLSLFYFTQYYSLVALCPQQKNSKKHEPQKLKQGTQQIARWDLFHLHGGAMCAICIEDMSDSRSRSRRRKNNTKKNNKKKNIFIY